MDVDSIDGAAQVVIPAHRDPVEYLRSVQERERPAATVEADVKRSVDEPSVQRHGRARPLVGIALGGVVLVASALWAYGMTTGDAPEAGSGVVSSSMIERGAPIVPPARIVLSGTMGVTPSEARSYEVRLGDTLIEIAKAHDTTLSALMALNDLSDPNQIVVGTRLELPSGR